MAALLLSVSSGRGFAQTADPNVVVDSVTGDVDQNEVDTFISFMTNVGGKNANAVFPTNALGDNLAYGTPGLNLEAINYMYRITGDLMVTNPSMSLEHMQLMNLGIAWSENFILLRNDQANGNHQVMWTGNVDHVWQTYATGTSEAGYAGSENGDTAGHILYTALNILQTPSIWNQTVPDGNPNNFGVTYLQRAQTYITMMEDTTQNYFTRYFINPTTYQIIAPTSPAWTTFAENMDAWNRQFLLTNDYLRLAQCHAILGDNPTLQALYTNIVKVSANAYVANAQLATASQTVTSAFPAQEAVYDSGYGNEGDLTGQITGNSSSHTSYEFQGIARTFEAGPAYSSLSLMNMERYANTVEYAMFNYVGYPPPPYTAAPFNVLLSSPYVTAYYKTIDAGLVLPTTNATSDYLYGQFYFMTPYNTLFWQPAANGAAPNNHNNYHNNPYYTTGILYAKHWVYMHPQTLIAVASNSESVAAGSTATYNITTNSTAAIILSIPDLPTGATATFSPAMVPAGTGSSTLTVSTSSTSVNGSVLFTLTGTSGSAVQTVGLSLVTTAPDFTISSTGTKTVAAGASGSYTITVKPLNGFTGDVTLSADPAYALAGAVITFNPSTITGGSGTSMVTATSSATVPTPGGEWSEGFIGTNGTILHEAYTGFTVNSVPQTISFPAISNVTYGVAPISLPAATSQNQPITYTVTGPATLTGGHTLLGQSLTVTGTGTVSATASAAAGKYDAAATAVKQSFTVNPAVLTVTAQNLTAVYGAAIPALTSTMTGFVNGDTSAVVTGSPVVSTTATTGSATGSYPITVSTSGLSAANYTFQAVNGTLVITQAGSTTTLTALPATTTAGQTVTLTATVASAAGVPTGTVTFKNGTATVGTGTLNASGVATFSSTTLAGANYNVTAVYGGNPNFTGSTSTASAFAVTDYTLAANPPALSILSGQTGVTVLTLTPIANFKGSVALTCGTLPANVTCAFSNATLAADGTGTPVTSTLTISTFGQVASADRPSAPFQHARSRPAASLAELSGGLVAMLLMFRFRRTQALRRHTRLLCLLVFSAGISCLMACSNGGTNNNAAPGTTTVVVTATGSVTHTLNLNVTIR